jgi:adenylate kinase family enzyme
VRRVVIMGRGAAGKSVLAARLGKLTGVPVIELDQHFWRPGPIATPREEWAAAQRRLAGRESWIMDGDLGPYDVPGVRLAAADTVIFLDFSLPRCAWRAIRRSPERTDFWRWLFSYRRRSRPAVLRAIAAYAGSAEVHVLRDPRAVSRLLLQVACDHGQR